ncbi:MAG: CHASE2 domain-containing protein [Alphaproteobacteria bacterium]
MRRIFANRWVHFLILFFILMMACVISATDFYARKDLQNYAFDNLNKAYERAVADEHRVLIIDIDDDSLRAIGQWPWSRLDIAKMVTHLTDLGAAVIAFDGVLAEPDRTSPVHFLSRVESQGEDESRSEALRSVLEDIRDHDEVLAESIKDSGKFVAGFTFSTYSQIPESPRIVRPIMARQDVRDVFLQNASSFQRAAVFIPELEKASAGNGSFMAAPDHDGVLRWTGMLFSDRENLYPSLSLEALRVALMDRRDNIRLGETPQDQRQRIDTDFRIVLGDKIIPVERDAKLRVYYRTMDREQDYVSAYQVIDPAYHDGVRDRVVGRVVFIGSSAEGLKDLRNSAIRPFIPGVEIHANVAEQILSDTYILRPEISEAIELAFIFVVGLFVILLAPILNVGLLGLMCAGLIGGISYGSIYAFLEYRILIDALYPALSVFLIFVISVILSYIRTEAERKQVRDAFGLYISPDFMKELAADPDKLQLGGEIKDLTVMFTDIRSFTTISEGLTPQELIALMNDFLTPMSDLVMSNRGTIDKYMGDAMMAFWNAPLDDPEHERHACRTALAMNDALVPINEAVKKKAAEIGKPPVLLNAGIGINTGPCAVGNMGSKQRFAYSALGDAVNLASRLEGQTKNYGVNILIGEATAEKISDMAVLEMDLIQVKGKTQPVRIFALLGDEALAVRADFMALKVQHIKMLEAYRGREFKDCAKLAKECLGALDGVLQGYLDEFYDIYAQRAKDLLKKPPPENWDGVYVATSK